MTLRKQASCKSPLQLFFIIPENCIIPDDSLLSDFLTVCMENQVEISLLDKRNHSITPYSKD